MVYIVNTAVPSSACLSLECVECGIPARNDNHYIIYNNSLESRPTELCGSLHSFANNDAMAVHSNCLNQYYSQEITDAQANLSMIETFSKLTIIPHLAKCGEKKI